MHKAPKLEVPLEGDIALPNGCRLFWRPDAAGGREYVSDEVGGGTCVWITSIADDSTLLAALTQEAKLRKMEEVNKERGY
jgi:hypothetical protein